MIHEDEDFGGQRDYKAERDTLIDDIAVLRANNKRLERENERLFYSLNEMTEHDKGMCKLADRLRKENKALRLQSNTYFDEWQTVKNLYTTLTNHIRQKAEANPNVDRYIALVNYIDKLERD
ncbi:hypothetical protein BUZ08_00220 [Staphylococcus gallinarum]|uniref:hypothetical protein n=1 Tax=Staphylococcus gallinarum TaxID=1293 RepID=UPI000D1F5008|nr:hypothetical protein [Staphylococcus gallinarum]MBU7218827.1 hypothetical protein [Staphylococcus gallinarum]PTL18615.1 hypothetical protein BUZ08_00220 [Staphylococcus gallinarum]RIO78859.1 hypothetical protein BUZ07_09120 [Staphylococcus gallinarum]